MAKNLNTSANATVALLVSIRHKVCGATNVEVAIWTSVRNVLKLSHI